MDVDRHQVVEAAQRLVEQQRYAQALLQYRKLIEADPSDGRALLKVGELHLRLGEHAQAIETFAQVGDVYAAQGDPHKALAAYSRVRDMVLAHEPQLEDVLRRTALAAADLYQQLGLPLDALEAVGALASRLEKENRWSEAVPLRRRALSLVPDDIGARVKLARALLHVDALDEAATLAHAAACQLVEADRFDDALSVLERVLQTRLDPACARMAAELYLARDTRQDAVRALTKLQACVRADPKDLDALHLVAHALSRVGHHDQAAHVRREMESIAAEQGRPTPIDPSQPPQALPVPEAQHGSQPGADGAIRVIPVTEESWIAIASRMAQATGEPGKDEEIVAFVRADDTARDTMRAIYGVVKFFFA